MDYYVKAFQEPHQHRIGLSVNFYLRTQAQYKSCHTFPQVTWTDLILCFAFLFSLGCSPTAWSLFLCWSKLLRSSKAFPTDPVPLKGSIMLLKFHVCLMVLAGSSSLLSVWWTVFYQAISIHLVSFVVPMSILQALILMPKFSGDSQIFLMPHMSQSIRDFALIPVLTIQIIMVSITRPFLRLLNVYMMDSGCFLWLHIKGQTQALFYCLSFSIFLFVKWLLHRF